MTDLSQSFVSNIRMIPISVQTVVDKWNSSRVNSLKKSVTEIFCHQEYSLTKNVDKPRRINIEWKNSNKNPNNPSNKIHAKLCLSECLFSFSLMFHDSDWLKNWPMRATISLYRTTTCHATIIRYARNNSLANIAKYIIFEGVFDLFSFFLIFFLWFFVF